MKRYAFHRIADEVKARISQIAAKDPELKILQIAARMGVSVETVRKQLGPEETARRLTRRSIRC